MTFEFARRREVESSSAHHLAAFRLLVLIGIISLFADMTGDGYYSVVGPYLGSLGATAAWIAITVGLGGLVAYTPRLASGWYCDHTYQYWNMIMVGLIINFITVPLLALVGHWELAFGFILIQRISQAIRAPARDAIISHTAKEVGGTGRAFGLHEAMSDIGSIIGPIIVALFLQANLGYSEAIGVLAVPALIAIFVLVLTIKLYPQPMELEKPLVCDKKVKEHAKDES